MNKKLLFFLLIPFYISGQVFFENIPLDKQLVGRNTSTNQGTLLLSGYVLNGNSVYDYDQLRIETFKGATLFENDSLNHALVNTVNYPLNYIAGKANFSASFQINSELSNYSLKIFGVKNGIDTYVKTVKDLVAGDVYIIQGQSNAEAEAYEGSANDNQSDFIRVFARAIEDETELLNYLDWHIGQGDGANWTHGNTGQWGLKLAKMIVDTYNIPVAIFNGARGNRDIDFFQAPTDYQTSLDSNYGRLFFRTEYTNLSNSVRAVLWSQGENDVLTSGISYYNSFMELRNDWLNDYPNIEKIYIFQSKSSCNDDDLMAVKEAQRKLAVDFQDIDIMQTAGLEAPADINLKCHFAFNNGYEKFASRIFKLIQRDIYNASKLSSSIDINPPMITDAYMTSETSLTIDTDATSLVLNGSSMGFELNNAGNATITSINVQGNKIVLNLSGNPGLTPSVTFIGAEDGYVINNFVTNSNGIELISFDQFPVNTSVLGVNGYEQNPKKIIVINQESKLLVKATEEVATFSIYNILGELLFKGSPFKNEFYIDCERFRNNPVLILKVNLLTGNEITRRVLKY